MASASHLRAVRSGVRVLGAAMTDDRIPGLEYSELPPRVKKAMSKILKEKREREQDQRRHYLHELREALRKAFSRQRP